MKALTRPRWVWPAEPLRQSQGELQDVCVGAAVRWAVQGGCEAEKHWACSDQPAVCLQGVPKAQALLDCQEPRSELQSKLPPIVQLRTETLQRKKAFALLSLLPCPHPHEEGKHSPCPQPARPAALCRTPPAPGTSLVPCPSAPQERGQQLLWAPILSLLKRATSFVSYPTLSDRAGTETRWLSMSMAAT